MSSCFSVLEYYGLFSGVNLNTRSFCFISERLAVKNGCTYNGMNVVIRILIIRQRSCLIH